MSADHYRVAFLECDADGCGREFECGDFSEKKTRNEAEAIGWTCNVDGYDYCPWHEPPEADGTAPGTKEGT